MTESLYAAEGTTSNYVTTQTNTTGQSTPILTISPDDGVGLVVQNQVDVGDKRRGIPIYMDLRDSNDDALPLDTEVEIAFVSQLKDFGIAAEILTLDSATFAEREAAGEFDVYPTPPSTVPGANVGYVLYGVARTWAVTAQRGSRMCGQLNWYPDEQCEEVEYSGGDGIIAEATAEGFSPFTLEAPPVGEWDGPLQEWEAPRMGWEAWRSPDPEQIQELYPQLAWLVNWWMPNLPIANGLSQQLYQVTHWDWPPEDDVAWEAIGGHRMAGLGDKVAANPDNPRRD
jgi:ABC-type transport system substrate-binding protein